MNNQLNLIKLLLNNIFYNKYYNYIDKVIEDNKEIKTLIKYIEILHTKYNKDISLEELSLFVLTNCVDKDKETYALLLQRLAQTDESSLVFEDVITDLLQRHKAYELALAALEVSEGRKDFTDLQVLANELNAVQSDCASPEAIFVTNDLRELHNEQVTTQGLRWRLTTLNRMLGSLRKGDFGFIFARPETGKTTFLASEITFFAGQTKKPVLLFNNEEQGGKVQLRLYQAMLGCTLTELFSDIDGNQKRYMELGGSNIKIYDSASIHRKQVEQIVRELEPSLIIFDQIDKIKGFADDREDLRLGSIYIWARELAKQYCPVIGVSQADASGEGKKWLTMENVANAKTAKQAEADWILGIGKSHADNDQENRYLHLSKNKLAGDEDTDPDLRHGKAVVLIDAHIARYKDI